MTGLDPDTDSIIEIYCLITDSQLELIDEAGWGIVVHQTAERMAMMDEWCTRVRKSHLTTS
jgi:oligoribonuclease